VARSSRQNRAAAIGYFGALAALVAWVVCRAVSSEPPGPDVAAPAMDAVDAAAEAAEPDAGREMGDVIDAKLAVLTNRVKLPGALTLDDERVFFTDYDRQIVASIPKSGGRPVALASSQLLGGGLARLRVLAVDGDDLFWTTGSALLKADRHHPDSAEALAIDLAQPVALAVDKANVYWMSSIRPDSGALGAADDAGARDGATAAAQVLAKAFGEMAIFRVARGGGSIPKVVARVQGFGCGLALDAESVYWSEIEPERLVAMPKAGGAARVLTTACGCDFLIDGDRVFCTKSNGEKVLAFPKGSIGAKGPDVLASSADGPDAVARAYAADATHLYWIGEQIVGESKRGAIYRVPKAGGKRERLTVEEVGRELEDLAVDDRWIFWSLQPVPGPADPEEAAIMRMAK
jgi:hypothetical protein